MRWDPHIHAPGTLLNNQYGEDWDNFIQLLLKSQPTPVALGVTDYFSLRGYKEARERLSGKLHPLLLFPNIEIRLTIETKSRQGVNLHLLVSPEDPEHVKLMEEKLASLRFQYLGEQFSCTEDGLRRLGRTHRGDPLLADEAALSEGANQFKIELNDLRRMIASDRWLQRNVLIAVAAGNDGLGGLATDAGFHALREELGRLAHIIFSGNPNDRLYWLGSHPNFSKNGQTPKPCLHGCDAHRLDAVLNPTNGRLCWIRAEPTFDGLRQTLAEPERRVHIGDEAPSGPNPSEVIRFLRIAGAPWINNIELEFNDGLVTVIGAKGSGKTALADLLALASDAEEEAPGPASFLAKAKRLLNGLELEIEWADGSTQFSPYPKSYGELHEPRVRYLSQQFVERLCSTNGLAEPLIEEIEKVVFSAIPEEDRFECSSFQELRGLMLAGPTAHRESERETIRAKTTYIAEERMLSASVKSKKAKVADTERERKALEKTIAAIPKKGNDENIKALQAIDLKLKQLRETIAAEERKAQSLKDLSAEIQRIEQTANLSLQGLQNKYGTLLTPSNWEMIRARVDPGVQQNLVSLMETAKKNADLLRVQGIVSPGEITNTEPSGLASLVKEHARLSELLGKDQLITKQRLDLEKRLIEAKQKEDREKKQLEHAEKSTERIKAAQASRLVSYEKVFETLSEEEKALIHLYEPLQRRLVDNERLKKLSFYVQRIVSIDAWAAKGETLLDLRKPPFQGKGALAGAASEILLDAWSKGSALDVREALKKFSDKYANEALDALTQGATPQDFGEWLFSTDHISVRYGIQYEGVELLHLSPGTRGVVLLTLYLALDDWDQRPLIIDQPEENLDPGSVFSDLVPFFREASKRRQIIMVTHNANLVVNTDSDQVIIAEATRRSPTKLPNIAYSAGGLEDPLIRANVCRLLEGGEAAFKKRGERYGVHA